MDITLPAETWMEMTEAYSAQMAAEFRGPPPEPVRARPYREGLYTVFSVACGSWDGQCWGRIEAWRLVPESLWDGETIPSYRDAGWDKTGLKVRFRKKIWICAELVNFLAGLPKRSMSLEEAQAYDAGCEYGWRRLWYRSPEITWHSLAGHPVVRYQEGDKRDSVLLWKYRGKTEEIRIADHIKLESPRPNGDSSGEQLTLF